MRVVVSQSRQENGVKAAAEAANQIRLAIARRDRASIVVATGSSQFEMLEHLVVQPDIRWDRVTGFHLDEYLGLPITHAGSFRRYLWERFVSKLPLPLAGFHWINGEAPDPAAECRRLGELITEHTIDAAMIGIGENGHLAFNDPPADMETLEPYIVVQLNEACREQQFGEGWFDSIEQVPRRAISMSIQQILRSRSLIVTVPDDRKARAVHDTLEQPITPAHPSTALRRHENATLYLDVPAASRINERL